MSKQILISFLRGHKDLVTQKSFCLYLAETCYFAADGKLEGRIFVLRKFGFLDYHYSRMVWQSYEEDDYFEDHYSEQTLINSGAHTFRDSELQLMREPAPIRWRKGELIGAGAYGRVYMGMNLESGELIAVKQV